MEEKDFIYNDDERGSIKYIGPIIDPQEDYTFNPSKFNELKNSGKYKEAKEYLDNYNYKSPTYYNKVQRLKDQCDTWILYNQHRYEKAGEENKETMDFLQLYDNDYNNLDTADNKLAEQYSKYLDNLFGDSDKISLNFSKTQQKLFGLDALVRDNKNNNINAYKTRLAESLGMKSISDSYLKANGIDVAYGDYDGAGKITVDKNSPFLKNVISSFVQDRYIPAVSRINKDGGEIYYDLRAGGSISGDYGTPINNYIVRMNNLVKDSRNVENHISMNDDYVAESINYPLRFYGSDQLDTRINNGGTDGSAASKMRELYEKQLIDAMRAMLPGLQDIRIFDGPSKIRSFDDNELASLATEEEQMELFKYIPQSDSDISVALNISNDGKCGFTFTFNGKPGSKQTDATPRVQFTVYNWNTEKINELMDANPEYRAIRKINEISRYNGTYNSSDGNNYQYIGGGYGAEAIYEDDNGNRFNAQQLYNIRMRDDLVHQQVNNILSRTRNRQGKLLNAPTGYLMEDQEDEFIASAIYIGSQVIQQNPIDINGKPLSVKDIAKYLRQNWNGTDDAGKFEYNEDIAQVNDYSYPILMYLRNIKDMIFEETRQYLKQRK